MLLCASSLLVVGASLLSLLGGFNIEPSKIFSVPKGISAGHWVDLEECCAVAGGGQPGVACKRSWDSLGNGAGETLLLLVLLLLLLPSLGATLMASAGFSLFSLSVLLSVWSDGGLVLPNLFNTLFAGLLAGWPVLTRLVLHLLLRFNGSGGLQFTEVDEVTQKMSPSYGKAGC